MISTVSTITLSHTMLSYSQEDDDLEETYDLPPEIQGGHHPGINMAPPPPPESPPPEEDDEEGGFYDMCPSKLYDVYDNYRLLSFNPYILDYRVNTFSSGATV